ncbi:hypothetical protein [Clavibacter tessellarius]|uniref:hypothetical protein n=1 Tax=Clavibacter tessellarius TaxID=31965 RepID=UPI00324C3C8B
MVACASPRLGDHAGPLRGDGARLREVGGRRRGDLLPDPVRDAPPQRPHQLAGGGHVVVRGDRIHEHEERARVGAPGGDGARPTADGVLDGPRGAVLVVARAVAVVRAVAGSGAEAREDAVGTGDRHVLHDLGLARLLARSAGAVLGEDDEGAMRDHRLQQRRQRAGHLLQRRGERVVQAVEERDDAGGRARLPGGGRGGRTGGGIGGVGPGRHPATVRPPGRPASAAAPARTGRRIHPSGGQRGRAAGSILDR